MITIESPPSRFARPVHAPRRTLGLESAWLSAPHYWVMYTTADVLSDASPPEPLVEAIAAIAPRPVLLIAADNIDDEVRLGTRFADTAPTTTQLWVVPDSGHTQALSTTPLEWTSRVLDLFAQALAPEPITQGPER